MTQDQAATQPHLVADIMTSNPITLREEDNLWTLQEEMQNLWLRHIPVVDGKKLVGLVTHRDLLRFTVSALHADRLRTNLDAQDKKEGFVADIMTRDVQTVGPNVTIAEAASLISKSRFGCLPVVEADGSLVGIVTENDFVKVLAAAG